MENYFGYCLKEVLINSGGIYPEQTQLQDIKQAINNFNRITKTLLTNFFSQMKPFGSNNLEVKITFSLCNNRIRVLQRGLHENKYKTELC